MIPVVIVVSYYYENCIPLYSDYCLLYNTLQACLLYAFVIFRFHYVVQVLYIVHTSYGVRSTAVRSSHDCSVIPVL